MDANEPHYVVCQNGVFLLPERVCRTLAARITNGWVYLREDEDSLTISTSRIAEGRRRVLSLRMRAVMFREATKLAIVALNDSVRVMGVEWRVNATGRAPRESPPAAR
jgi:hypothetical protein